MSLQFCIYYQIMQTLNKTRINIRFLSSRFLVEFSQWKQNIHFISKKFFPKFEWKKQNKFCFSHLNREKISL